MVLNKFSKDHDCATPPAQKTWAEFKKEEAARRYAFINAAVARHGSSYAAAEALKMSRGALTRVQRFRGGSHSGYLPPKRKKKPKLVGFAGAE